MSPLVTQLAGTDEVLLRKKLHELYAQLAPEEDVELRQPVRAEVLQQAAVPSKRGKPEPGGWKR